MLPFSPKFKKFAVAATVMLAAMTVLWWSLWMIAAAQYRDFIENWIATHRETYDISYASRNTQGFPRNISLHFTDFILRTADGVRIHAHDVSLSTFLWQWHRFDAKLKHGFEIAIPFTGSKTLFIVTDETARNHTELADNGDWNFVDLNLAGAKALWGQDPFFSAEKFSIGLQRPDTPPKTSKDAGLTLACSGDNLVLPPGLDSPFGAKIEKIDARLRVMGAVPDPRLRSSVAAWNGAGGSVEFDKFFLNWAPLLLETHGTLGLDDDLQPEGAFSARIGNQEAVLKVLLDQNYIPKRETGMLNSAMKLFTKKISVDGKAGIEVPIAVQLGGLFLGPVRIFEFSEINWGEESPPAASTLDLPNIIAPPPVLPELPAR